MKLEVKEQLITSNKNDIFRYKCLKKLCRISRLKMAKHQINKFFKTERFLKICFNFLNYTFFKLNF